MLSEEQKAGLRGESTTQQTEPLSFAQLKEQRFSRNEQQRVIDEGPKVPEEGSFPLLRGIGGFLGGVAKDIATPFARFGVAGVNLGESIFDLARGDVAGAQEALQKKRDVPLLGETAPVVTGSESAGEAARKSIGNALEIASNLVGGAGVKTGVKQLVKSQFKKTVGTGIKVGAQSGALFGAGRELQEDETTDASVLLETIKGGAMGGVFGGALGAGGSLLRKSGGSLLRRIRGEVAEEAGEAGTRFGRKVKTKLEERARIKELPKLNQEAIKVGFSEPNIDLIRLSSPTDKKLFEEMLKIREIGTKVNTNKRPENIIGETIIERVEHLFKATRINGEKIKKAVEAMPKDKILLNNEFGIFTDGLEKAGIRISRDTKGKLKLNYKDSLLKDNTAEQKLVDSLFDDFVSKKGKMTPTELLRIRRRIFKDLDLGKAKNEISPDGEKILLNVRESFKKILDDLSSDDILEGNSFERNNNEFAIHKRALDEFYKFIGQDWRKSSDEFVKIKVGEVANKLDGRTPVKTARIFNQIDLSAKASGLKLDSDIAHLIRFKASILDGLFGKQQVRDFSGAIQKGITAGDVARAGKRAEGVADLVTKSFSLIAGITQEEKIRVLRKLIGK